MSFSWGSFGENLTTEGLREDTLCIGDLLKVGSAVLMVTQPRMPCYKLVLKFGVSDMIERFLTSRRSGFYFSVIEEGEVCAGSEMELLSRDPHRVTVADVGRLYLGQARDLNLLRRVMNVPALPVNWKAELELGHGRIRPSSKQFRRRAVWVENIAYAQRPLLLFFATLLQRLATWPEAVRSTADRFINLPPASFCA